MTKKHKHIYQLDCYSNIYTTGFSFIILFEEISETIQGLQGAIGIIP
jgi:hypothetical protein